MMISPEVLRGYPYFAGISGESLQKIALMAQKQEISAGTRMFGENEPAKYLYLILEGEASIQYELGTGELRTVDTLVPGDLLVWSALVEPHRTTGVGIATRETQLVAIDACKLRALCEQVPELGVRLMTQVAKLLANRLEGARVQLAVV